MAILNHGSTLRTADGGQTTTTIVTAANIGTYGVATNSTYYVGTTQNIFNRASGAQTLTGVSIDGNAATVTNGLTTGNYNSYALPLAGGTMTGNLTITKASAYLYLNGTNSDSELRFLANSSDRWAMGMNVGDATENLNIYNYTTATTNFTILKASGNVGVGTASPSYKLDVSGAINASTYVYAGVFYDNDNTVYYTNPSGTSNLVGLTVANTITGSVSGSSASCTGNAATATTSALLTSSDVRTISPSSANASRLTYGFTSYSNNNTGSWADYLHLRSYADGTGGNDNLVMFNKNAIGMRIWQQAFGSATAYATYKDVAFTDQGFYIGTTSVAINRASASQTLTGVSIDGNAATATNGLTTSNYVSYSAFTSSLTSTVDARAPIFYDSNDTAYYVNPNSSSNLSILRVFSAFDTASSDVYANMRVMRNNATNDGMYIGYGNLGSTGGITRIFGGGATTGELAKYIDYTLEPNSFRAPIFYDSNDTAYYTDPNGTSVLNRLKIDGGNYAFDYFQSLSDFVSGTLVTTDIPASAANGLSFVMNVIGKSYSSASPFDFNVQGYLYNSTIINYSGMSLDSTGLSTIKVFENGGFLCFWWARVSYWNAFEVSVRSYDAAKTNYNRVTNITDVVEPTGTKKVTVTLHRFMRADASATNSVDLRAPIFYDSDNTVYYVNPNSTSNLYDLTLSGGKHTYLSINPGNSYEAMVQYTGGTGSAWYVGKRTSSQLVGTDNFHFYSAAAGATVGGIDTSGNIFSTGSVRSPIFYDSNDTAYYVDPASTSILNGTRHNTVVAGSTSAMTSAGQLAIYSSANPYISFHDGGVGRTAYMQETGGIFYFGEVTYTESEGSFRAPLFYDSNNTAYYLDPASTSNLNNITAAGTLTVTNIAKNSTSPIVINSGLSASLGLRVYYDMNLYNTLTFTDSAWNSQGSIFGSSSVVTINAATATTSFVKYAGYSQEGGSFRAPIFYDSDNTAYYIDPASTSNLNALTMAGTITGALDATASFTAGVCTAASYNYVLNGANDGGNKLVIFINGSTRTADGGVNALTIRNDGGTVILGQASYLTSILGSSVTINGNAALTSASTLTAGNLSGTIPSGVLGNSTHYVGTTAIALNRASAGQTLTGISIDGNSGGIYAAGGAYIQTTSTGTSYGSHIQVREAAGGGGLTSEIYAPALGFHWAAVVASNILMESSGRIAIRDNPGTGYENFIANIVYGNASVRSPIFYDSNNTTYYVDPASTGYSAYFAGAIQATKIGIEDAGLDCYMEITDANPTVYGVGYGGEFIFYGDKSTPASFLYYGGATVTYTLQANSSLRSPIFYDSNDTTYYTDPAGFSLISSMGIGGLTSSSNVQMFDSYVNASSSYQQAPPLIIRKDSSATGAIDQAPVGLFIFNLNGTDNTWTKLSMGSREVTGAGNTVSIAGLAAQKTAGANGAWATGNLHFWTKSSATPITNMVAYSSGYVQSDYSFRAPIFYDSNDTAYYLDPAAGTSLRIAGAIVGDHAAWTGEQNKIQWHSSHLYFQNTSDGYFIFRKSNGAEPFQLRISEEAGYATGSWRAPIFYDSNDTAYYLDPRSASVLSGLKLNGIDNDAAGNTSDAILWINKPNNNDWGIRVTGNLEYLLKLEGATSHSYNIQGMANGSEFWRCGTDLLYHNSNIRAPIFYDSANTAYYINPDGVSNLVGLTVVNQITGSISGNAGGSSASCTGNAVTATTSTNVSSPDGDRNPSTKLPTTNARNVRFDFSGAGAVGGTGNYAGVMTYAPWDGTSASTGDSSYQLAFLNETGVNASGVPGLSLRNGINSTWGSWYRIITSGNIASQTVATAGSCTGNSATTTLATKATRANGNFYIDDNYGNTVVGVYTSTRYQGVYAMGDSYKLAADGTTTGTLYGIAWSHQNAGGAAANLASHGLLILENGVFKGAWGGGSLRTPGDVRGTLFYDWDNTGYYCDPASTSNLNAITAAGNITAAQYYTGGWFRNNASGNGLYNEATGQHFYSDSANYWNVASSASTQGIRFRTGGHAGTVRGYIIADTNNDVGLLNQDGNWRVRVVGGDYTIFDGSSIRAQIFYDSNDTGYYTDPAGTSILNVVRANSYVQKSASQSLSGTVGCTIDVAAAGIHVLTLAASTTISSFTYNYRAPNPSVNTIMLVIKYGGTASITWTNVLWANGVTPSLTSASGYADVYMLTSYQGGAATPSWIGTVVAQALVSTSL